MPNSPREYRGGTHQGIDFICSEQGRDAVVALPGRVVIANTGWTEPTSEEREALLDVARELEYTPPWILAMLYGQFVVIDHGNIDSVGHVATIYAHLAQIDDAITPGASVEAGQIIGEIGNTGTSTAAAGGTRDRSLHLHWELHVADTFFGSGLSETETVELYEQLFLRTSG